MQIKFTVEASRWSRSRQYTFEPGGNGGGTGFSRAVSGPPEEGHFSFFDYGTLLPDGQWVPNQIIVGGKVGFAYGVRFSGAPGHEKRFYTAPVVSVQQAPQSLVTALEG